MAMVIWSESPSPLGRTIWKFSGVAAPQQYLPWLSFETKQTSAGANTWSRVDSRYPILATIDGVLSQTNEFKMYTEFSALQNIISDTERARLFDEHVLFLLKNKPGILAGNVKLTPITPVVPTP